MPIEIINWEWEEAFDKFGFGDGEGPNFTHKVADFIRGLGYEVSTDAWGIHSTDCVMDVLKDEESIMGPTVKVGYSDPRQWLPPEVVEALDKEFPASNSDDAVNKAVKEITDGLRKTG